MTESMYPYGLALHVIILVGGLGITATGIFVVTAIRDYLAKNHP